MLAVSCANVLNSPNATMLSEARHHDVPADRPRAVRRAIGPAAREQEHCADGEADQPGSPMARAVRRPILIAGQLVPHANASAHQQKLGARGVVRSLVWVHTSIALCARPAACVPRLQQHAGRRGEDQGKTDDVGDRSAARRAGSLEPITPTTGLASVPSEAVAVETLPMMLYQMKYANAVPNSPE